MKNSSQRVHRDFTFFSVFPLCATFLSHKVQKIYKVTIYLKKND